MQKLNVGKGNSPKAKNKLLQHKTIVDVAICI